MAVRPLLLATTSLLALANGRQPRISWDTSGSAQRAATDIIKSNRSRQPDQTRVSILVSVEREPHARGNSAEKAVNDRLSNAPEAYLLALASFAKNADSEVVRLFFSDFSLI